MIITLNLLLYLKITTLRDIDDIVNNVVSLNNDQKNEIKQKSKETKEALVKEDIDKFVGIINNSI